MSTPRLFHVSREAFHCFSNVNSVLSNIRQLDHKLRYKVDSADVSFSEFSICAVCSSVLLTRGESTPFTPVNFMLSKAPSTSFVVSLQRHLIIQHINFDCSIQDLQLLLVVCTKSNVAGLFHLKPFLKGVFQRFATCNHTEVVTMTQSFEISIATAEESWARGSDFHGTLFQHI